MRARTALAKFLVSQHQISKSEALRWVSAYRDGTHDLGEDVMTWLGSVADIARKALAEGAEPRPQPKRSAPPWNPEVYSLELCQAIVAILSNSRFFVPHLAQAKYGDFEAGAEGLVWVLRPFLRRKTLVRVTLNETLVKAVRVLAKFGRTSAPNKNDFLLAWPDGNPFSQQQIRYAARKGGYKPCSSNDSANAQTSDSYSTAGAKRSAFQ